MKSIHGTHQVLEDMPVALCGQPIYFFLVPFRDPLGKTFQDFTNVEVTKLDANHQELDDKPSVEYFSSGKLGALHGGLLHLDDHRAILSADDIKDIQKKEMQKEVEAQRPVMQGSCVIR